MISASADHRGRAALRSAPLSSMALANWTIDLRRGARKPDAVGIRTAPIWAHGVGHRSGVKNDPAVLMHTITDFCRKGTSKFTRVLSILIYGLAASLASASPVSR